MGDTPLSDEIDFIREDLLKVRSPAFVDGITRRQTCTSRRRSKKMMSGKVKHMTADRIAALRVICDAATPPPWKLQVSLDCNGDYTTDVKISGSDIASDMSNADASFIAASRTALPEALDEIVRLRAALNRIAGNCNKEKCDHRICMQCVNELIGIAQAALKGE